MKDIIRKMGEKAAVTGLKAAEKAAPAAASAALKTGKVALKAGSVAASAGAAAANAGSEAVANHKRKRAEKDQLLIDELKNRYPGCRILLSKFDPYDADIGGYKSSLKKVTAYEIYDEYYALQYSAEGIINIEIGRRRLNVYNKNHGRIGSCTEHGVVRTTVSIESNGKHVMDLTVKLGKYEFSDIRYEYMKEKSSKGILIGRSGHVLMEIRRIKGYEVIAVVDPSRIEASMLLYSAIKLAVMPRPYSCGGG